MRDIKFRVYVIDETGSSVMVYSPMILLGVGGNVVKVWSDNGKYKDDTCKFVLMQYTDVKDRNGKEVYEGDILKVRGGFYDHVKDSYGVKWFQEIVRYDREFIRLTSTVFVIGEGRQERIEVVGNIYENPELIENGNVTD